MPQLIGVVSVKTPHLALQSFSGVEGGNKPIPAPRPSASWRPVPAGVRCPSASWRPVPAGIRCPSASWRPVPAGVWAAPEVVGQLSSVLHCGTRVCVGRKPRTCYRRAQLGSGQASAEGDSTPWESADSRVLSPVEHWEQSKPLFRIWHGFRTVWLPGQGPEVVQSCHGVRGMVLSADGEEVVHTNDWWDWQDFGGVELPRYSNKTWTIQRSTDSLPDGILHPASPVARLLSLPSADGAWVGTTTRVGDKFLAACECFLMAGPDARLAIGLYWMGGRLNVTLYREKCLPTAERDPKALAEAWGVLDRPPVGGAVPAVVASAGVLSGAEFWMTGGLELRERTSTWGGYGQLWPMPGSGSYSTLHLPAGVSVTVPTALDSESGAFAFSVDWVPSESQVSSLAVGYGAGGELLGVRGGRYN